MVPTCEECTQALQRLGISSSTLDQDIKSAFRDLVRVWHPDRFLHDPKLRSRAEQEMKKINVAYDHLNNHVLKTAASDWQSTVTPEHDRSTPYSPYRYAGDPDSESPFIWRCCKVALRIVWRLFKVAAMLGFGVLLLFGVIGQLATYWSNEVRKGRGDLLSEIKSWKTDLYVSDLLGIPVAAVRGLIFVSTTLLLTIIFIGNWVAQSVLNQRLLALAIVGTSSLCFVGWASFREYQSEFVRVDSSPVPGAGSWVLGLVVLLSVVTGAFYLNPAFHATVPLTPAVEQQNRSPVQDTSRTALRPRERWRPKGAVEHMLVWDFRNEVPSDPVKDSDTLETLRIAIEPNITSDLDGFVFYGPLTGNFLGEGNNQHQKLYTAILNWVQAGRSHAEGDVVFAVVLGGDATRVFQLQGGGVGIGALRLKGAKQDLLLSMPEWTGQGQTLRGLSIYALSKSQARRVAGISTTYADNCESGFPQLATVADRIFADVDATGDFNFINREHWSSSCFSGAPLTLISRGSESAEDALVNLPRPGRLTQ